MTVGYFGNYNSQHPRNKVFLKSLKATGFELLEINHRTGRLTKYFKLIRDLWANRKKIDVLIVGFPGQQAMVVARIFFWKPIIFNALLSLYDAVISDRRQYKRLSIRAAYFWALDYISFRLPNMLLFDCNAYIDYAKVEYGISEKKCRRIFLGADEEVFRVLDTPDTPFEIHYYSSFIPTHGTDVIVRAAKILEREGIRFILSGRGQCYQDTVSLAQSLSAKNIQFIDRFSSPELLNEFVNSSWITLGIFGDRPRMGRIIASKVFEALACGKPVVTAKTRAGEELLVESQSVIFVKRGDPADLAEKILRLKTDDGLRSRIAAGGRSQYETLASKKVITRQLAVAVDEVAKKS